MFQSPENLKQQHRTTEVDCLEDEDEEEEIDDVEEDEELESGDEEEEEVMTEEYRNRFCASSLIVRFSFIGNVSHS